jgi:hypothetical protein
LASPIIKKYSTREKKVKNTQMTNQTNRAQDFTRRKIYAREKVMI